MKTKEECINDLRPYYQQLVDVVLSAQQKYRDAVAMAVPIFKKSTYASGLNDYVQDELKTMFGKHSGFSTATEAASFLLLHKNCAIRPKKVDEHMRSKNIPTRRIKNILSQQHRLHGVGFEYEPTYLTLGYQLSELGLVSSIHIICEPSQAIVGWSVCLYSIDDSQQPIFNFDASADESSQKKRRVKPLRSDKSNIEKEA